MFENDNSLYVVFGLLAVFIIGHYFVQKRQSIKLTLQYRLIYYAVVMIILYLQLPTIPGLASIGNQDEIMALGDNKKFLDYLERCNDTMKTIKDVIHFMIFITVFWFVSIVSSIIKHFELEKTKE